MADQCLLDWKWGNKGRNYNTDAIRCKTHVVFNPMRFLETWDQDGDTWNLD